MTSEKLPENIMAIVAPSSSGADYPEALRRRGWGCVTIDSGVVYQPKFARRLKPRAEPSAFMHHIPYKEDFQSIVSELEHLGVRGIVPGCENGVLYADKLNQAMNLKANGFEKSLARRNKFLMHQEVSKCGLRVPRQAIVSSYAEATNWIRRSGEIFPVVVKPTDSGGSDGVFVCQSYDEMEYALARVLHQPNIFGEVSEQVLISEYVDGVEYVVNSVSCGGRHYITDMWRYEKGSHNGSAVVYEAIVLLERQGQVQDLIAAYSQKVLTALDFQIGASHMEIKVNTAGEAILIEVGSRIAGASLHQIVQNCTANGKSQLEYTLDAYIEPNLLTELERGYDLIGHGRYVPLISRQSGVLQEVKHLDQLTDLSTYHDHAIFVHIGDAIPETIDFASSPGKVVLLGSDSGQVQRDYKKLREIELSMLTIMPQGK